MTNEAKGPFWSAGTLRIMIECSPSREEKVLFSRERRIQAQATEARGKAMLARETRFATAEMVKALGEHLRRKEISGLWRARMYIYCHAGDGSGYWRLREGAWCQFVVSLSSQAHLTDRLTRDLCALYEQETGWTVA